MNKKALLLVEACGGVKLGCFIMLFIGCLWAVSMGGEEATDGKEQEEARYVWLIIER